MPFHKTVASTLKYFLNEKLHFLHYIEKVKRTFYVKPTLNVKNYGIIALVPQNTEGYSILDFGFVMSVSTKFEYLQVINCFNIK
jgi:hypothetical protein